MLKEDLIAGVDVGTNKLCSSQELARLARIHVLRMTNQANSSHVGTCLSCIDLLAVLYRCIMRYDATSPQWLERDRFIFSKGHGAAALYAVLAECDFYPLSWLDTYYQNGSLLTAHVAHEVPGIEASTGSLGHGLPIGCGMALSGKRADEPYRVFVMLGDGELDEGSNWESALFAPHHNLDNLVAIVDYNRMQGLGSTDDVLSLEPLGEKWQAFGWGVREVNGHDHDEILEALANIPFEAQKPSVLIAHTTKGKGISFMENQLAWHYKSPNAEQLSQALKEMGIIAEEGA